MTLAALISVLILLISLSIKTTTLTQTHCLPHQRDSLIKLKQGFNTTELHSWNTSTDCCIWDGITCDEQTGLVTVLNLTGWSISGELKPALFNLSSLRYLDLSYNFFDDTPLPQTGFERLGNLTHLDLSYSNFVGQVPIGISALTNLISLDLSNEFMYLYDTGLKSLLSNLSKLQVLYLDGVNISLNGNEWGKSVFQVSSNLKELSMVGDGLSGNFPDEIFLLTNLTVLDLSNNPMYLYDTGLKSLLGNLRKLQVLYLDGVNISLNANEWGKSVFQVSSNLKELSMADCGLSGNFPDEIFLLTNLRVLDLSKNWNMYLYDTGLKSLLGNLSKLQVLHLDWVNISLNGNEWDKSVFQVSSNLKELSMVGGLSGNFPQEIFHLTNLTKLDLSSNPMLSGQLSEFPKQSFLQSLYLPFSNFTGPLADSIGNLQYLTELELFNNNFYGEIPPSITNLTRLKYLDLSSNKLTGTIPLSLFSHPSLQSLDLSNNQLSRYLPEFSNRSNIYSLDLSNNSLTGEIPYSICNVTYLQLLDLSYNNLIGTVPPCLLENAELEVLNLKSNKLSGPLPQNISQACGLQIINLNGNLINGSLPKLLKYCNALKVIDMGNNRIVNRFPYWLANLENLSVLILKSNMFYGEILDMELKPKGIDHVFPMLKVLDLSTNHFNGTLPENIFVNLKAMMGASNISTLYGLDPNGRYNPHIASVTYKGQRFDLEYLFEIFCYIDMSNNEFRGIIPEEIGQIKSLDVLNLSHNALTGTIPSEFANLHQLQLLDLSYNQLSGHIPEELVSLTFLSALNLSYNNFVGEIPEVRQFSTFSNDSYLGNPGLCGSPLSLQCPTPPSNHGFNEGLPSKSSTNVIGIFVSIGLGIGVGFVFVIWATISWENGRKWFNFIIDRFYLRHFH